MHRRDQMTLRQLRALKSVGALHKVTAAAEALNLTAPAIHNQLKNLEDIIGAPLLERESKDRAVLTLHGQALVRAYEEIQATFDRTLAEIDALDRGLSGSVRLGVVSTAKYFAPRIIALLAREMPEVDVQLEIGNRGEVVEAMAHGAYDLCVMGRPPREPLVDAVPVGPHPHVIIARPDHPLAGRTGLKPSDLAGDRFVIREPGSGSRMLAERFLVDVTDGLPVATIAMSSNETIKQSVLQNLGIAVISAHTVAYELAVGRLVVLDVKGMPINRTWYLTGSPDRVRSPAVERVRDWLLANAHRYLPDLSGQKGTA
ncbi:LysR family transcriptional regulator [Tropicimonas sp. IMCC6043]|uniref:LysR family transcriptional regulator n=1 Tax=Tropicimonas sp. IMCC6043 TaxID=2510645 RepID=UPI00101C178E|nr:LysR family transcriptional regulator [Tropicimonas sp. IMCC6043]RYH07730.1 LysR family transcriptional regulator [Tropicimonas sp. IMCC6043]